jgi:hypothetical protein
MNQAEDPRPKVRYLWLQPGVRGYLALVLGIPLAGNINIVSSVYTFLRLSPPGAHIRTDMIVESYVGVVAFMTALLGLPLGIVTAVRWRSERVLLISGIAASVLSLTPFLAGTAFLRWYASFRGLVLSP